MKKKVIALIAVAALSVSALTGCGSNETAAMQFAGIYGSMMLGI